MTNKYNLGIGFWKAVKNNLVIFAPAIIAFLLSVPAKYTPIASVLVYMIKNYIQNK